ncbi:MAG: PAS domain S-box protein [Labilithrix sp.]|nr:PAS domain S-box protein [Labilithrix sp.]
MQEEGRPSSSSFVEQMWESADVCLAVLDLDLRVIRVNALMAELAGGPRASLIGRRLDQLLPALAPIAGALGHAVLETGHAAPPIEIPIESSAPADAGPWFATSWPLFEGERVAGVGVRIHRAARNDLEAALRKSEARFRAICEASPIGIFLTSKTGAGVYTNATNLAQMGCTLEETHGDGWQRAIHPDDRERVRAAYLAMMQRAGAVYEGVNRYLHRDGREVLVDVRARGIYEGDEVIGYVGMAVDITERAAVDAAHRESELRFRQLAENIRSVFWLAAPDRSELYYVSPAYEEVWGRPVAEAMASPDAIVRGVHPDDRERVRARIARGDGRGHMEYRVVRPGGSIAWIAERWFPVPDESGRVVRVAGIANDVTRQKALETELLQAQKLDSLGRLAGGIAHDFNNLLTVILNQGIMAERALDGGEAPREELALIQDAAKQATDVTRQLLAFARRQPFNPTLLDPNELTEGVARLMRRILGESVELVLDLEPEVGVVRADRVQLEQLLMNLALNARDAMRDGGKLVIRTRNDPVSARSTDARVPAGAWVTIAVEDTGHGIDEADRAHIFDPFFSTKPHSEGTGLGLAICYAIVKQHGGHVVVDSAVGMGTTFELYFPRVDGLAEKIEAPAEAPVARGAESILVVEDEPSVRAIAVTTLTEHGFRVLQAASGADALRLLEIDAGVDLVLTDVVMPDLGGAELGRILRDRHPALPVLYMSGYPDGAELRGGDGAALPFLEKPFVPSTLLRRIRDVLDARVRRPS